MKIPKKLEIIGSLQNLWYLPKKFRNMKDFEFWNRRQLLLVNPTKTILFSFPEESGVNFEDNIRFDIPNVVLKNIGLCKQIIWRWDEIDETLLHTFDDNHRANLYVEKTNKPRIIAIKHDRGIVFNKEGII